MEWKGVAQFDDVVIDFDRMEIWRSGHAIPATDLEFRLLGFFMFNPQIVFSREELIRAVWPKRERRRMTSRIVDNYIAHLRQKLEEDPRCPVYFQTVLRAGYKFMPEMKRARSRP